MSDTVRQHVSKAVETPVRRIEVFTGFGRRRRWSAEEKAAIVAESYGSEDTVCAVARRYGLTHAQLFGWRRSARGQVVAKKETPLFVPAVVETPPPEGVGESPDAESAPVRKLNRSSGLIEVEIAGVTVRVGRGAEPKTVTAVIRALKTGS